MGVDLTHVAGKPADADERLVSHFWARKLTFLFRPMPAVQRRENRSLINIEGEYMPVEEGGMKKVVLEVGENLTREDRLRLTGPALGAFFSIADRWGLSAEEEAKILGLATPSIAKRWRGRRPAIVRLPVLIRISCVLGIFRALNSIFSDRAQADGWLRRPNAAPLFAGECALDRIQSGELGDLLLVRRYLEAEF